MVDVAYANPPYKTLLVCVDKHDLQNEQQRHNNHAWADFTPAARAEFHHAIRDEAERDTFGD